MNINHTLVSILAAIAIVPVSASAADLTLKVENVGENTGALRIAIFDAGGWSGNDAVAADSVDVSEGADSVVFEGLEPGTYGVKLFHDVDGDGELARGKEACFVDKDEAGAVSLSSVYRFIVTDMELPSP